MPGPLPDPRRKRTNAPTIPTTALPMSGLAASGTTTPTAPRSLGAAGKAWWRWAWLTPQAAGWGVGAGNESMVGRRASLEDDLATIAAVESLDLLDVVERKAPEVREVVQRLAALATGRLAIMREMRELDDRLGLTPKGLAALRWQIVADPEPKTDAGSVADEVSQKREDRRSRVAAG